MRASIRVALLALGLAACNSRGSLVVVTVEAAPPLAAVTRVAVTVSALGTTRDFNFSTGAPLATPFTLGVDLPPSASGAIALHVSCLDAAGAVLGAGDGAAAIKPGGETDVTVVIGGAQLDGGADLAHGGKVNGEPCASRDECSSLFCADGVCCDRACNGTCEACDQSPQGTCVPVTSGQPHGSRGACAGTGTACAGSCSSASAIACTYPGTPTVCGAPSCSGAPPMRTAAPSCNGAGACVTPSPAACVAPQYATPSCSGAACDFACNSGFARSNTSCVLTWSVESPPTGTPALEALFAISPTDVYAVGDAGTILHSTGNGTWTAQASNTSAYLNAAYGYAGGGFYDLFAVGSGGAIMHNAAIPPSVNWQPQTSNTPNVLSGIWGAFVGDLHVVGRGGVIRRSLDKGATWTIETSNTTASLLAVWGSSASDLYAVGYVPGSPSTPVIIHSTGNGTWSAESPGATSATALHAVWGSSATDVYAVGDGGTILHSTGNGVWAPEASNQPGATFLLWGWDAQTIYAVGFASPTSVLLYSTGSGSWGSPLTDTVLVSTLKNNSPYGISGTGPSDVYIVGSGPILHGR